MFISSTLISASDIVPSSLETGIAVVPHDKAYYKYKDRENDVEIIYTKDNLPFAKHTAGVESLLHKNYKKFFAWELDETLYVGLISSHNQIANGFSTQWPNNRQINYVGGTQMVDYFTSTSWLDTLLYHETAHNYQVNVKNSIVSRTLHSVFGNGSFMVPLIPIIVPNVAENSFMLEGNAVLNESWHGNGGRLYSGRFKVETILQAKAGNIKAGDVYNSKLAFPYGNIVYIQGGFYNLYMAEKYSLKSINSYFLNYSTHWYWPFITNGSMRRTTGVTFEASLNEFAKEYAALGEKIVLAKGEPIASSQFFSSLGNDRDEIFFITNESGVRAPELVVVNKKSNRVTKDRDSWMSGKVIKVDGEYLTQGSRNTSVIRIHQGLFDSEAFIKDTTESKMVQGYLSDGKEVYFDVPSSYSQPQLYVNGKFYAQVNSSVIIDKNDNLYYFKQNAKDRTLYKNKTALYTYRGFYGIVSDVDSKGGVFFVANSELGSTLYKYSDGSVTRASQADNIIEARLINDSELLIAAISEKDYYYVKSPIATSNEVPFETKLFFEDKSYYGEYKDVKSADSDYKDIDTSDEYYSALDMHYSGTNLMLGYSSLNGVIGELNINFGDPLSQNSANIFVTRDDSNVTIAGAGYSNSQYLLQYSISGYGVVDKSDRDNTRDGGVIASAELPFYQAGYFHGTLGASYYQDYDTKEREPLSATLNLARSEAYGVSMYYNCLNSLSLYGAKERDDDIYGGVYTFKHDLPTQFYFGVSAKYSRTDSDITEAVAKGKTRGVKVTNISYQLDMDPTTIYMPSASASYYFKSAAYGDVTLAKVLNFSTYWFTFPFSLQRESVFAKYRYYDIERFNTSFKKININEVTLGTTVATVLMNKLPLPITLEYIYNDDDSGMVENESTLRLTLGMTF